MLANWREQEHLTINIVIEDNSLVKTTFMETALNNFRS